MSEPPPYGSSPQPAAAYPQQPAGGAYPTQPAGAYPAQPAGVYPAQPVGAYPAQPAGAYPAQPSGAYPSQPAGAYPPQSVVYPPAGQHVVVTGAPPVQTNYVTQVSHYFITPKASMLKHDTLADREGVGTKGHIAPPPPGK